MLFTSIALLSALTAETEKLDYLPRPKVGLEKPVVWPEGQLNVLIQCGGGPDKFHDHQVCNRDIDGNTIRGANMACLYTEYTEDLVEGLKEADVFLCGAGAHTSIDGVGKAAVEAHLATGKGIIFSHNALWHNAWKNWPEKFTALTGRAGKNHVNQETFTVTVTKAAHPIMKGVPANFLINDELYRCNPVPDGVATEILATAVDDKGVTYPMVWTVKHGESRIVCIALGHDESSHHDFTYRKILLNAINWAAKN